MAGSNFQTAFIFVVVLISLNVFLFYLEQYCYQSSDIPSQFNNTYDENGTAIKENLQGYVSYLNPTDTNCQELPSWYKLITIGISLMLAWYFFYPLGKS